MLTKTEKEVLEKMAEGKTARCIAIERHVTVNAITQTMHLLKKKLNAQSHFQLGIKAKELNLL